jgi:hypothetical protein
LRTTGGLTSFFSGSRLPSDTDSTFSRPETRARHEPATDNGVPSGYVVEESLSVDNMFIFALLFWHFAVPLQRFAVMGSEVVDH